ncbi:MAG TPA: universal stress protein, partial [Planctomycetaceae bacterium]
DVGGGNRIPRISERKARTVAELRAAGIGVRRVLMVHDNTHRARDLFDAVLTMLDPDVAFDVVHASPTLADTSNLQPGGSISGNSKTGNSLLLDIERAEKIGREVTVHYLQSDPGPGIVKLVLDGDYDLLVIDAPETNDDGAGLHAWQKYVREHASCVVSLMSLPAIQREVVDTTPSQVGAS